MHGQWQWRMHSDFVRSCCFMGRGEHEVCVKECLSALVFVYVRGELTFESYLFANEEVFNTARVFLAEKFVILAQRKEGIPRATIGLPSVQSYPSGRTPFYFKVQSRVFCCFKVVAILHCTAALLCGEAPLTRLKSKHCLCWSALW